MKLPDRLDRMFRAPKLTRPRIILALAIAASADGFQFLLNGVGWVGPDQAIDIVAMLLTSWLIGFHWLLLPTFVINFIPALDDLPSWVACVIAVIVLRKREQRSAPPPTPPKKPTVEI
jgi:hypothetical protein